MTRPRIEIKYCTRCKFLLRAAWVAQELLATFEDKIAEVVLVPSTGGIFEIRLDGDLLFSNKQTAGFPEAKDIKRLVRDRIAPGMRIGHENSQP